MLTPSGPAPAKVWVRQQPVCIKETIKMQGCPWFTTSCGRAIGYADCHENLCVYCITDKIISTSQPFRWGIGTCHACARSAASVGDVIVLVSSAVAARDEGSLQPLLPPQVFSQPKIVLWEILATDHESQCLHRKISFRSTALSLIANDSRTTLESYIDFLSTFAHIAHMFLDLVRPVFDHLFFTRKHTRKHAAKRAVTWSECCASLGWQARSNITGDLGALAPGDGLGRVFLILLASSVAIVAFISQAPINPLSAPCSFYHFLGPRRQQRPDQVYQISGYLENGSRSNLWYDARAKALLDRPECFLAVFLGLPLREETVWVWAETVTHEIFAPTKHMDWTICYMSPQWVAHSGCSFWLIKRCLLIRGPFHHGQNISQSFWVVPVSWQDKAGPMPVRRAISEAHVFIGLQCSRSEAESLRFSSLPLWHWWRMLSHWWASSEIGGCWWERQFLTRRAQVYPPRMAMAMAGSFAQILWLWGLRKGFWRHLAEAARCCDTQISPCNTSVPVFFAPKDRL